MNLLEMTTNNITDHKAFEHLGPVDVEVFGLTASYEFTDYFSYGSGPDDERLDTLDVQDEIATNYIVYGQGFTITGKLNNQILGWSNLDESGFDRANLIASAIVADIVGGSNAS